MGSSNPLKGHVHVHMVGPDGDPLYWLSLPNCPISWYIEKHELGHLVCLLIRGMKGEGTAHCIASLDSKGSKEAICLKAVATSCW